MKDAPTDKSWIHRAPAARKTMMFAFHLVVFALSYVFAWLVRFEFRIPPEYAGSLQASLPVVVGTELTIGWFFGFYKGWWRYVGIADVVRLVVGLSTSLVTLVGTWFVCYIFGWTKLNENLTGISRGALLINWAFSLLILFGTRVVIRVAKDWRRDTNGNRMPSRKVLIIGAGDAGEALAREIEHRPQLAMRVVAFVDDDPGKRGSQIRGIDVVGPIGAIEDLADATGATEALIAIPSATGARIRDIVRILGAANLPFKTIPGMDQLVSGKVHATQLRAVNVEDLLRREKIELPGDPVRALFRGKRVMVTGAGGSIGSEIAKQILELEPEHLALVERSEYALYEVSRRLHRESAWLAGKMSRHLVDIGSRRETERLVSEIRPHVVLHAAAHKHVPLGEENPGEYVRNNTLASRSLAEISQAAGVERFVLISTDKAINPTSVMGASKRAAEIALIDLASNGGMNVMVVRFGNVIGSSGSVVPLFVEQIAAGGPVTVTHPDVTRYFLRTAEAVSLVLQAATLGGNGRVFMLDMGEPVKIVDLARDLIQLSNHTLDEIPIVFTGLRPGEKLFEEISMQGESIHPTVHPRIVITEAPQPAVDFVRDWLSRAAANIGDHGASVAALKELVPEYTAPHIEEAASDQTAEAEQTATR